MKKINILLLLLVSCMVVKAQVAGDTIVVQAFNYAQNTYGQGNREMMVPFPNQTGLSYSKILMLYNMRCKGGVTGNQVPPGGTTGCGEWDYSCNTYITDSTKTDSAKAQHPSHIIPGFSGNSFSYAAQPTYTYYQYNQQNVVYTSTLSETSGTVGTGGSTSSYPFHTQQKVNKSQYLWTASELLSAGISAGNITSIRVNVSAAGGAAKFLKVKMKHTTQTALNASSPDLTGFTEVYFLNTTLSNGVNQLNFYNPFNWNGSDNVLIEFSFTNTTASASSTIVSEVTSNVSGIYSGTDDYSYDFTSANIIPINNTNLNSLTNQVSVSFWSYGNSDMLPNNTSVFHGHNNNGTRQINVHLPWSNSRIYWDCGNASGYDRIDQLDSNTNFKGKWTHWAFTKNTTTGIMNIYINGALWHTGSNKTIALALDNLILGAGFGNTVPYFGKMDEFTLWNAELSLSEIQNWMYRDITNAHPKYSNLLAYYKFNEGSGSTCNDNVTTATSSPNSPIWAAYKGKDIFKGFVETSNRPTVTFVQGSYVQTNTNTIVMDSVVKNPYTVYSFSTNGTTISPVDTNTYYQSGYTYVYDGDLGTLLDSVNNATSGSINITPLNYYTFSPARFQIMSFVTPYGNGLNLGGATGKTWTFDVSDYAPILKGDKRITMDAGGQWQEDMDIKFLFIVGTPPRAVKDINNIWKVESIGYTNILNDSKFEPKDITLSSEASSFKVRTAITGHGQEGEFIPQNHFLNINGGNPEYSWDVWKACGENPIYPQGGTWIYDRAGWCPGMATDTKEMNIDSFVTPGVVANFDYGMVTAQGSSNYWVSNQLVSYGAANFSLDAAVVDIINPSNKVEYARTNSICANPKIVIQNTGSTPLTSLTIKYWVNNFPIHGTYHWTGNLKFMETEEVTINSSDYLWRGLDTLNNVFYAEVRNPNGGVDAYSYNNKMQSPFTLTPIVPSDFYIMFKSNNFAAETDYKVLDEEGNIVFSRSNMANVTTYKDTLHLGTGCYSLVLTDSDNDGISFWANSDGSGYCRLMRLNGQTIKIMNPDFGRSLVYNFTIDYPLSYEEVYDKEDFAIYPNPSSSIINIRLSSALSNSAQQIALYNTIGQKVLTQKTSTHGETTIDVSKLTKGMYYLKVGNYTKKVIVE